MARELGEFNVTVNSLSPGLLDSEATKQTDVFRLSGSGQLASLSEETRVFPRTLSEPCSTFAPPWRIL